MQVTMKGEQKRDEPLSLHTSMHTGGKADVFVLVEDMDDLLLVVSEVREIGIPCKVIGQGTNLLFSDDGFRGYIMKLGTDFAQMRIVNERVYAGSAAKLKDLVSTSVESSLSGLERLYGIPGSVGGAACTNAGAYGTYFADLIKSVTGVDEEGNQITFMKDEIEFGYRRAVYPARIVITEVELQLARGSRDASLKLMEDCMAKRGRTQPLGESTAGCIFKNPPSGISAAKLIEQCGLKGRRVGDAVVSSKHANFIVNEGQATTKEILELIRLIVDEVRTKMGVELSTEVEVVA